MKKATAILLVIICFQYASCIQENYSNISELHRLTLPEYSENGTGTLGCMIDGKVWTVFGKHWAYGIFGNYWQENFMEVSIYRDRQDDIWKQHLIVGGRMTVVVNNVEIEDKLLWFSVELADDPVAEYHLGYGYSNYLVFDDWGSGKRYYSDSSNPVILKMNKYDLTDSIASGVFNGYLFNEDDRNDSVKVDQGRFDLKGII